MLCVLALITFLCVRWVLPASADRCGGANRLHFHTIPSYPEGPRVTQRGCRDLPATNTQPLIPEMRLRLCCSTQEQVAYRPEDYFKPLHY